MLGLPKSRGYAADELIRINAGSTRSTYAMLNFETTVPVQRRASQGAAFLLVGSAQPSGIRTPHSRREVGFTGVGIVAMRHPAARVDPKALTGF